MLVKNHLKKLGFALLGFGLVLAIAILNYQLILPWFSGQGPANLGSIEVSYVSMARFLKDFSPHLSFAPYWYFGFPFHLFYTPVLPFLVMLLNKLGGIHLWEAYRIVSGVGFIFIPASLFLFVWTLTKKIVPGILAGLIYTFSPSPFYFILSSGEVAADTISRHFFDPRRLVILARWGEGPHTLSLVFVPLAALFYLQLIRTRKFIWLLFTAAFVGLTALTNAVGLFGLVFLLLSLFFSEWVKKPKKTSLNLKISFLTALASYGLIAFWYNLSFIGSFFGEGGGVLKNYAALFPWGWFFFLLAGLALYFFCQKIVKRRALIVSLVWFVVLFLIVWVYYASAPSQFAEKRIELAPQALRLMTEADMAVAVTVACLIGAIISFLQKKNQVLGILGNLGGLGLAGLILVYGFTYLPAGQKAVSGEIDLKKTGEYEIAQWLKDHVNQKKGERVYVAGNYGFYLNYFTNLWQLRGGLFQAMTHPWPGHIYYQMSQGKDEEIALAWLKAANIRYLVVNKSNSRELYKEFKYPEKFLSLKLVWEKQGDLIYELPHRQPAKVVALARMKNLAAPQKADDKIPLLTYVNWLEENEPVTFEMVNHDLYKVRAQVGQDQGVLVQMTYDSGFKARSAEGRWQIKKDPLGFMVLVPPTASSLAQDYEVTLTHGKTWQIWLGYATTLITVGSLVVFPFIKRKSQ